PAVAAGHAAHGARQRMDPGVATERREQAGARRRPLGPEPARRQRRRPGLTGGRGRNAGDPAPSRGPPLPPAAPPPPPHPPPPPAVTPMSAIPRPAQRSGPPARRPTRRHAREQRMRSAAGSTCTYRVSSSVRSHTPQTAASSGAAAKLVLGSIGQPPERVDPM